MFDGKHPLYFFVCQIQTFSLETSRAFELDPEEKFVYINWKKNKNSKNLEHEVNINRKQVQSSLIQKLATRYLSTGESFDDLSPENTFSFSSKIDARVLDYSNNL